MFVIMNNSCVITNDGDVSLPLSMEVLGHTVGYITLDVFVKGVA